MDDLNKKSISSKSQVSGNDHEKRSQRSKDLKGGEMLRSGSFPRFGDTFIVHK